MTKQISSFKKTIALATLSSILSIVFLFLVLPVLTTSLFDIVSVIDLISASTIIGYLGIMIAFVVLLIVFIIFDPVDYKLKLDSFVYATIYSVLFLAFGSMIYVIFCYPEVLNGVTKINIFIHLFVYPSVIAINIGSSQLIWIISVVLFVILFNLRYYSLFHIPEIEVVEKPSRFSTALLWVMIVIVVTIVFLLLEYNLDLVFLLFVNISVVLAGTAVIHLVTGYILRLIRRKERKSETILEHSIFYSISDILYIILRNSYFPDLVINDWIMYDILTMILAILIFYHISAINYLISRKFKLSVDIFGEVFAIVITFILEYIQFSYSLYIITGLIIVLSFSMMLIIIEKKVY